MPRRQAKNRDLPDNLYAYRREGKVYYIYRRTDTRRRTSLGTDRKAAVQAARLLNNRLHSQDNVVASLVAKVEQTQDTLSAYIPRFRDELLPAKRNKRGKGLSEKTLAEYTRMLRTVDEALGAKAVVECSRRDVSGFLDGHPATARNRYRSLLHNLFAHAVAEGLRDDNPVAATLPADEVVQRTRLTLADFQALRSAAPAWFVTALDLAVTTLQRREDLVTIEYPADKHLYVVQQKTGVHLRLPVTSTLERIVDTSRDDVECPYIIHRKHESHRAAKGRSHKFQVTPDQLTRTFAALRDKVGVASTLDAARRPTFHELRALGAELYRQRGIDPQMLLGHLDAKTTRVYLDRHKVAWTTAEATLEL